MATVTCSHCKTVLAAEGTPPPAHDAPCPACGHIGQDVTVGLTGVEAKGEVGTLGVTIVDYPKILLQEADALLTRQQQYGLSIVVAHTACEVATERAFSRAFASRGVPDLEDPVTEFFISYNMGNDRVRRVYVALTGDLAGKTLPAWWSAFAESVQRRNRIVHRGERASQQEAMKSLNACAAFVDYLNRTDSPK
jgi:hypothetical protein